jgi:quinol-cytochrome oxidoreductase complex cytochrome b subunit
MKNTEKEMLDNHSVLMKKILKSLFYTFLICIFSIWGIGFLVQLPFRDMTVEQSNTLGIFSICIGIIFTIFYCTFTIVEEIRKKN